jgi:hypothetical protein
MDRVRKPNISESYTPSPESYSNYNVYRFADRAAVNEDTNSAESPVTSAQGLDTKNGEGVLKKRKNPDEEVQNGDSTSVGLRCIGILPGLGLYPDSSDSEQSSDTDQELASHLGYDLLGRKITEETKSKAATSSSR